MKKPTCFQLPSLHLLCAHPGPCKGLVLSSPPLEISVYPQSSRAKGLLVAPLPGVLSLSRQLVFLFPPSEREVPPFFLHLPRACLTPRPSRARNHGTFHLSFCPCAGLPACSQLRCHRLNLLPVLLGCSQRSAKTLGIKKVPEIKMKIPTPHTLCSLAAVPRASKTRSLRQSPR